MASAMMILPMFLFSLLLEGRHDEAARTVQILMQCLGTIIFMALTSSLRYFLARNFSFKKADGIILCLITFNIIYAVAASAGIYLPKAGAELKPLLATFIALLGIAQAGLGMRLFELPSDLGGMKRPYCWLNIVTGICTSSLLLIPIGIVTSAVGDLMLGTIFFQEARRLSLLLETDAQT
jgi:hypothetical protein